MRAQQPQCPSCALGEAFCRMERGKGRARQLQPPQRHSQCCCSDLGPPQRARRGGGVCPGVQLWGCAPLILLLSRSFITSPSLSWSLSGSACKELGCICPSDRALSFHRGFSSCPLAPFSDIFIFLTLNTCSAFSGCRSHISSAVRYSLLVLPLTNCLDSGK